MFNTRLKQELEYLEQKKNDYWNMYMSEIILKHRVMEELRELTATRTAELANFTKGFDEAWRENDKLQLAYGNERIAKEAAIATVGEQAVTIAKQVEEIKAFREHDATETRRCESLQREMSENVRKRINLASENSTLCAELKSIGLRYSALQVEIQRLRVLAKRRYEGWMRVYYKLTVAQATIKDLTERNSVLTTIIDSLKWTVSLYK